MIIAVLGDVHGNLPALEAVLEDARSKGVEEVWNLGDFVGYGPFPDEVVTLLKQTASVNIPGNYDRKAIASLLWDESKKMNPLKKLAFQWAGSHLSPENQEYLSDLPEQVLLLAAGLRILLVHGSPASMDEALTPATSQARLETLAGFTSAQVILCGHSHQAFARQAAGTWIINAGTIGRPDDGDPRAGYTLLHLEEGQVKTNHYRRVAYEVERTVAEIRRQGLPEAFARMFLEGRSLDDVLGH